MKCFTSSKFDGNTHLEGAWQAWCFGPSLITDDGDRNPALDYRYKSKHPRTVLGYYAPGHYCFIVVNGRDGGIEGASYYELYDIATSLGCKLAYNLDGGNTSVLVFNDTMLNNPGSEGRRSSDIIYVRDVNTVDN
jgi:exopolysaccharide biosynthesis protein